MRKKAFIFLALALLAAADAQAAQRASDLFGIKMKSPSVAGELVIEETPDNSLKYSFNKEMMDERISATANLEIRYEQVKAAHIRVKNGSDKPLVTKPVFSSFAVVTKDGQEYELDSQMQLMWPGSDHLKPGKEAVFAPTFGGLPIKKKEIKMIICSFDMGDTKIVLLPRPLVVIEKPKRIEKPKKMERPGKEEAPAGQAAVSEQHDAERRWIPPNNNFAWPKKDRPLEMR